MVCAAAAAVLCCLLLHPVHVFVCKTAVHMIPMWPWAASCIDRPYTCDQTQYLLRLCVCESRVCIHIVCIQTEAKRLWKLNEALSLGVMSPLATLYAPMAPPSGARGLPHLHWHQDRAFHTSALCGAALDSITLPYRLHSPCPTSPLGMATGLQSILHLSV